MTRGHLMLVCVCTVTLAGCELDDLPLPLVGTLERDRIELVAEASEQIVEVLVTEGEHVSKGQLLMRLDASLQNADIQAAAAVRDRYAQRLAELVRGPRRERIREAQARLQGARENLAVQTNEFERVTELVERRLTSASALDQAKNNLEGAEADVQALTASLDELLEGTTAEELAQAEAQLAEAEARLSSAKIVAMRLDVVAPRDGWIDAFPYKLGERPPARATVIVMLADQAPYARVYVPEDLRASVAPGTTARIRVDGVEQEFDGRVRYVSQDAAFTPYFSLTERDRSRLAFLSEITLIDESARSLPSGVPLEVDFPGLQ